MCVSWQRLGWDQQILMRPGQWCTAPNTYNYRMITSNRKNKCGGGLALVHKVTLPVKTLTAGETRSFQYAKWSIRVPGSNMVIIAIYHPLYSIKYPVTNAMFIDDITEWLSDHLVQSSNAVMAGGFNIHINKQVGNEEAGIFVSTLELDGAGNTSIRGNTQIR